MGGEMDVAHVSVRVSKDFPSALELYGHVDRGKGVFVIIQIDEALEAIVAGNTATALAMLATDLENGLTTMAEIYRDPVGMASAVGLSAQDVQSILAMKQRKESAT